MFWGLSFSLLDQIYADIISSEFAENKTDEMLLQEFREIYFQTWDNPFMQKILRTGANWMVSDDHDFVNNASEETFEGPLKRVLWAGRKAFYQYQYTLVGDPSEVGEEEDVFYSRRIGNVGLYFLDIRVHRAFHYEPDAPLLGQKQLANFKVSFPFLSFLSFCFLAEFSYKSYFQ